MIRLIGILTGSALAIAILILTVGVPELERPDVVAEATVAPPLAMDEPEFEQVMPEPESAPPEETEAPDALTVAEQPAPPVAEQPVPPAVAEPATPAEQSWFAFWSPFRSRIAADGFVAELQRTTGLDYRVVKIEPGIYEVAFAYTDDDDIQSKLARIADATGMDMSGG